MSRLSPDLQADAVGGPNAYSAPTAGQSTPVTSAAATDLDDAAAAIANLHSVITALIVSLRSANIINT